ncbi:MAG: invasion associated locus B family protein [Pseudomonadota bacterium]
MLRLPLVYASVLATTVFASAGYAQTTESDTTESDQTFPVAEADNKPYIKETFGTWAQRCVQLPEQDEQCTLQVLLRNSDDSPVAEFNMQPLPNGGDAVAGVTMVTPLGTLLTQPMTFQIDGGAQTTYPYQWCEQAGCVLRFGLTRAQIDSMKAGLEVGVKMVSILAPNEPLELTISLDGFTAAWQSVGGS